MLISVLMVAAMNLTKCLISKSCFNSTINTSVYTGVKNNLSVCTFNVKYISVCNFMHTM